MYDGRQFTLPFPGTEFERPPPGSQNVRYSDEKKSREFMKIITNKILKFVQVINKRHLSRFFILVL